VPRLSDPAPGAVRAPTAALLGPLPLVSIRDKGVIRLKRSADTIRHMDRLSMISRWFRVQHAGMPRWFLGFVVVFVGVVGSVLLTHWGR